MRRPRTITGRLLFIFAFLAFLTGVIVVALSALRADRFLTAVRQKIHVNLAQRTAERIQPLATPEIQFEKIEKALYELLILSPEAEVYLVSEDGTIVDYYIDSTQLRARTVSVAPIQKFLNSSTGQFGVILGTNPKNPKEPVPFSAAPLKLGEGNGFVYIVLAARANKIFLNQWGARYLLDSTLLFLLILVVMVAVCANFLVRRLTWRLETIITSVRRYREGEIEIRCPEEGNDDISELGQSINEMSQRINSYVADIEQRDESRRELMAFLSHDLRTPVTGIIALAEAYLANTGEKDVNEIKQCLTLILGSGRRLEDYLAQLFELAKLDSPDVQPQFEVLDIADFVVEAAELHTSLAQDKGLIIGNELPADLGPEDLILVRSDPRILRRVLQNLVSNAIHYTDSGSIVVGVKRLENAVEVFVQDPGPGITQEEQKKIFETFYRSADVIEKTGTGLGLAIVQAGVEKLGSRIQLVSEKGKGTRFSFSLPLSE